MNGYKYKHNTSNSSNNITYHNIVFKPTYSNITLFNLLWVLGTVNLIRIKDNYTNNLANDKYNIAYILIMYELVLC